MKKKSYARLKNDLDKVFSQYIRFKESSRLYSRCYTCNKKAKWSEQQAGHYVSRSYLSLRWDERNVKVQCVGCNIFKKGNLDEYAIHLRKDYGPKILEVLNKEKHKFVKYSTVDLQMLICEYKAKFLAL